MKSGLLYTSGHDLCRMAWPCVTREVADSIRSMHGCVGYTVTPYIAGWVAYNVWTAARAGGCGGVAVIWA